MNGKKLARTMQTVTDCISELSRENDALRGYLRRISKYQSVERLRSGSEKDWGLPFEEALEMAYENVISEAVNGLRWKPTTTKQTEGRDPEAPISREGHVENKVDDNG